MTQKDSDKDYKLDKRCNQHIHKPIDKPDIEDLKNPEVAVEDISGIKQQGRNPNYADSTLIIHGMNSSLLAFRETRKGLFKIL